MAMNPVCLEFREKASVGYLVKRFCKIQIDDIYWIASVQLLGQFLQEMQQVCGARLPSHKAVLGVLNQGVVGEVVGNCVSHA